MELQELLAPATISRTKIEARARVNIKKERKKKTNDNLQQNYKRYK